MSYILLTLNERNKIEVLNKEGCSSREISKILVFHHFTIAREINRCKGNYLANTTQTERDIKASLKE